MCKKSFNESMNTSICKHRVQSRKSLLSLLILLKRFKPTDAEWTLAKCTLFYLFVKCNKTFFLPFLQLYCASWWSNLICFHLMPLVSSELVCLIKWMSNSVAIKPVSISNQAANFSHMFQHSCCQIVNSIAASAPLCPTLSAILCNRLIG